MQLEPNKDIAQHQCEWEDDGIYSSEDVWRCYFDGDEELHDISRQLADTATDDWVPQCPQCGRERVHCDRAGLHAAVSRRGQRVAGSPRPRAAVARLRQQISEQRKHQAVGLP